MTRKSESQNPRNRKKPDASALRLREPPDLILDWIITLAELRQNPDEVDFETMAMAMRGPREVPKEVRGYILAQIAAGRLERSGRGRPAKGNNFDSLADHLRKDAPLPVPVRSLLADLIGAGRIKRQGRGRPLKGNMFEREIEIAHVLAEFDFHYSYIYHYGDRSSRLGTPYERAILMTVSALKKSGTHMSVENVRRLLALHRPRKRPGLPDDPFWEPKPRK